MDKKDKSCDDCGGGCGEGMCGGGMCGKMCGGMWGGGHHGHHVLIWVIKIVILITVFWFGLKIGEIKGALESGYMRMPHLMMRYGYDSNDANYLPMMYGQSDQNWAYQATSTPKAKSGK